MADLNLVNFDYCLRSPVISDVPAIFSLIQALAEYEKLTHAVTGTVEALEFDLFGDRPVIEAVVAEVDSQIVGFALFFQNYSTFLTKRGLYLEDIFVLPEYRGAGIGKAF
jgi:GNAT superfamily N-acetyltransferase